jgi:bifunctional ADP-heptose synthase (sugar kinase/adenylyltransferase)
MDTRNKILTAAAARELRLPSLAAVTGYFDILTAGDARELEEVRDRTGAAALVAIVLPLPGGILDLPARAELAAGLRVIDYVVIADEPDLDTLIAALRPRELVHLEAAHTRRARQLREHVRRRTHAEPRL